MAAPSYMFQKVQRDVYTTYTDIKHIYGIKTSKGQRDWQKKMSKSFFRRALLGEKGLRNLALV